MNALVYVHSFSVIYPIFPRADPVPHLENMGESDIIGQLSVKGASDCDDTAYSLL